MAETQQGVGVAVLGVPGIPPMPQVYDERVNHPAHYGGDTVYEVIKVMEAWLTREEFIGAMKFNIHKYTARAGKHVAGDENFDKSLWYQNYLKGYLERHPQ